MTSKSKTGLPPTSPNGSESAAPPPATPTETPPNLTPEEQSVVDAVARYRGNEWAYGHLNLILNQAREIGDL